MATLQLELLHRERWATRAELAGTVLEHLEAPNRPGDLDEAV